MAKCFIFQVSDITGKPIDAVSVALHESNYDVAQAIQNIIDGQYDCIDVSSYESFICVETNQIPAFIYF